MLIWHRMTLIKVFLNETCSNSYVGKHFSDSFPIQNGQKLGNALWV